MSASQIYDSFATEWSGKRCDFDHVFGFQCVDLIKQYLYEKFGITGETGNALNYWTTTSPVILNGGKFVKVNSNEPHKGDIVVLTINHIGISNGAFDSTNFQILDQNGGVSHNGSGLGSDAIQVHSFRRSEIAGILRPVFVVAAPIPPPPKYTVIETYDSAKQVKLNKQPTNLYGMNYDFDYMKDHPVETHNQGEVWTITNKVHHIDGYDYYRRDGQIDGFNVADCDDYTPPPAPYVPPAAPNPVKRAETYTLDVTLPFYASVAALQNTNAATGHFPKGTYYVWSKAGVNNSFYQLSTDNIHEPVGQWVNILNNKVPAVKAAVREAVTVESLPHMDTTDDIIKSWQWFYPTHEPLEYKVLHDMDVYDQVHSSGRIPIKAGQNIDIYGSFTKNGRTYLRPLTSLDDKGLYHYYGIETTDIHTGAPHLENEFNISDIVATRWESIYDKVYQTIDGFFRPRKKK